MQFEREAVGACTKHGNMARAVACIHVIDGTATRVVQRPKDIDDWVCVECFNACVANGPGALDKIQAACEECLKEINARYRVELN